MTITLDKILAQAQSALQQGQPFSFFKNRTNKAFFGTGKIESSQIRSDDFSFARAPYDPKAHEIQFYQHARQEQVLLSAGVGLSEPSKPLRISKINPVDNSAAFQAKIKAAQDEIRAGRFYVLNITTQFHFDWQGGLGHLVQDLFKELVGAYAGQYVVVWYDPPYFHFSITPELFVKIDGPTIQTEPIKGTVVPNNPGAEELSQILTSSKEKAEHLMIVDLLRNDIGRLCKFDSVKVRGFQEPYQLNNITHTYSTVTGDLLAFPENDFIETSRHVLQTMLPGGSVTGTPKHEVVHYLRQIESHQRNFYTGCFAIAEPSEQRLESALLIRYTRLNEKENNGLFGSGAGITVDSDPESEWREIHWKFRSVWERLSAKGSGVLAQ